MTAPRPSTQHPMTMHERKLALVRGRGRELDRVHFVIYDGILPADALGAHLRAGRFAQRCVKP